jgi:catechol 2,3-dioxygenase-like lactoylglutathione lyase family enzyme/predicted enzyme related to lactoylglutathione lyase
MIRRSLVFALLAFSLLTVAPSASAQLVAAKDGPVAYGHHHLNATNIEEQKKFFVNTLGGAAIKVGTNNVEIVKFPNVLIFFRMQAPTGGTKGTTANHIGFSVPNLRAVVDKIKANGFKMITTSEVAAGREVKDDIAGPQQAGGASIAFALGPDEVKVELVEARQQTAPIQLHHIHFFGQQNVQKQAWYVKTFGAKPRAANPGAAFVSADLPGVTLNFTPSPDPVVGTQGRAVDHIGFEVKNLEAFTKKLEADGVTLDRPYTKVAALDIAIAFIKDPWGTYIELTEGLDRVR